MKHATVADVLERRRPAHELRAELSDLWRDGFHAGAAVAGAQVENLEHIIGQLEWEILNPDWRRKVARETLAALDAVRAREQTEARRAVLDRLEQDDLFEYRRLAHLRLTDEPAYTIAVDEHVQRMSDAAFEGA